MKDLLGLELGDGLALLLKVLREEESLDDADLAALDDIEVCGLDSLLLVLVGTEGDEGDTLALAVRMARNLGADDSEPLKDVIHVLLLGDERQVEHSDGELGLDPVRVGLALLAAEALSGGLTCCRGRGLNGLRAAGEEGATVGRIVARETAGWIGLEVTRVLIETARGRELAEGLCARHVEEATVELLSVELLDDLVDAAGVLERHEGHTLGPAVGHEDVDVLDGGDGLDEAGEAELAGGEGETADEDLVPLLATFFDLCSCAHCLVVSEPFSCFLLLLFFNLISAKK